jgi:hypothetical protein
MESEPKGWSGHSLNAIKHFGFSFKTIPLLNSVTAHAALKFKAKMFRKSSSTNPAAESHPLPSDTLTNCIQLEITVVNAGGSQN